MSERRRHHIRLLALLLALTACKEEREFGPATTTFEPVEALLARACAPCHAGEGVEAQRGVRLDSYLALMGCTEAGAPLTRPADGRPPLLAALDRPDHAALLTDSARKALTTWLAEGAPGARQQVHGPHILDPRSAEWHGALARERDFAPLRDASDDAVCGRCHDGAPTRPAHVRYPAPDAPSCTSCHDRPGGVLACPTCHGQEERAYPPRDGCWFGAGEADAHARHVEPSRTRASGLACATCHPTPDLTVFSGAHADGSVDVRFAAIAGSEARFDAADGTCMVACHARGGSAPTPSFRERAPLDCNGCHLSPPPDHYPGACGACHAEMGATPDSLRPGPLHIDGTVDVGGGGPARCGSCHGEGDDPWPADIVHARHRASPLTTPIECASCHVVPSSMQSPGHGDGIVQVRFGGRALHASAPAAFAPDTKSCTEVACHIAAASGPLPIPRWAPLLSASTCSDCHAVPPPPPHVQQAACGGALCHGSEVGGAVPVLRITEPGRSLHIDGALQAGR